MSRANGGPHLKWGVAARVKESNNRGFCIVQERAKELNSPGHDTGNMAGKKAGFGGGLNNPKRLQKKHVSNIEQGK